ncbi:growth hormone-inducible transmembrane protein [Halyomorpha halys]|uniref:growth hormone-inducible transmembrane protein n=1 Tax=Halyomorpha halys TaxID=286706 RepID=UPI000D0C918A|nr:uncharacterized protein LOC112210204 [Halyomorpha halys]
MDPAKALIWGTGKIVTSTGIVASIACLIFWLRVEKKGTLYTLKDWSTETSQKLVLTYFHLISSYILNFISFAYALSSQKLLNVISCHPYEVIVGIIILMSVLTTLLEFIPYCPENNLIKIVAWFLHSTVLGLPLTFFGTRICTKAVLQTILMLGLSSLMSFLAPNDFYKALERRLTNVYYLVTLSSICCLLIDIPVTTVSISLLTINFLGGIVLYFCTFIINTQFLLNDILTNESYDPIYTSAVLYLCTMNLYIRNALYYFVECSKL